NDSDGTSLGVIAYPAILNDADVQLHNFALLNAPLAADAVNHFVVKRDANVARENAVPHPITQKCTLHAGLAHEVRCCFVHLFGRNTRANQIANAVENVARSATCLPHFLNFPGVFDRNHRLSSISREMSLKTPSRSRLPS